MSRDRYVRVARALALLSAPAAMFSCASTVVPYSGDSAVRETGTDVITRPDASGCLATCPPTVPAPGVACIATLSCTYPSMTGAPTDCYCDTFGTDGGASCGTLRCSTAVPGPLPPPELAA